MLLIDQICIYHKCFNWTTNTLNGILLEDINHKD